MRPIKLFVNHWWLDTVFAGSLVFTKQAVVTVYLPATIHTYGIINCNDLALALNIK